MPTANVNGVSLEYQETGTGEPVVLVHGGISDHRIWQIQREALGQNYRAIAYSCRYHWPNAPASPDTEQPIDDHVGDLIGLVKALDAAPTHLVGNSSGGLLCLLAAIRAPELVRSLVLLEPFALPLLVTMPPRPLALFKLALHHPRTAAAAVHFGARGLGRTQAAFERGDLEGGLQIFTRAVLGQRGVERMTEARRAQAYDNLEAFAAQLTRGTFPPANPVDLRRIAVPTLLLTGAESPSMMHLLTDRVHDLLPRTERVEIPGASHDAHVDNPSAVTHAVQTFLDGQTGS
jgi:pimeloyl-ACP methyl ester carboxylesterase